MSTPETLTITKPQLEAAMLQWTKEHRAGECSSDEDTQAMTDEDLAEARASCLWDMLEPVAA